MAKNRSIPAPSFTKAQRDVSGLFRKPASIPMASQDATASAKQEQIDPTDFFAELLTNTILNVRFFKQTENAKIPEYGRDGDACLDLFACLEKDVDIYPEERLIVSTGVGVVLPPAFEMQIRPRSGNAAKKGLGILNSPGTIDANYRGTIGVILFNASQQKVTIKHGDAIAQAKISWAPKVKTMVVQKEDVEDTNRGEQGFGSTGLAGGKS